VVAVARLQVIALAVAVAVSPPARARAPGYDVISRIAELNREALDELDQKSFAAARRHLREAVDLAKRQGLATSMILARTYLHIGALEILAGSDHRAGKGFFVRALQLNPHLCPSTALRRHPDVVRAFQEVLSMDSASRPQCPAPELDDDSDPELPAYVAGLDCRADNAVLAESPLIVRCAVPESVELTRLVLHYQSGAMRAFKDVWMRFSERGWWKAVVPANEVTGPTVRIYVDGRNHANRRLLSELGDARRPTIVFVR
jgi:hypothetical protein